jgi:NAD(P)-dependent dehydrogenase (short-subunit alcohol dehydrogenase family)
MSSPESVFSRASYPAFTITTNGQTGFLQTVYCFHQCAQLKIEMSDERALDRYSASLRKIFFFDSQPGGNMPVIAILGAGSQMGLAIARTFGAQGYEVALLSRHPVKQDSLISALAKEGIKAAAFRADVLDRSSIASGLADVKQRFGPVDVLEYSPADAGVARVSTSQLTHYNLQIAFDFNVHGAFAAVQAVLPDMQTRRAGTILFTTGASSVYPHMANDIFEIFANFAITGGALRAYAYALHAAVGPSGIQVGHVAIGAWIGKQPGATPEAISPLYWQLHTQRNEVEKVFLPETNSEFRNDWVVPPVDRN